MGLFVCTHRPADSSTHLMLYFVLSFSLKVRQALVIFLLLFGQTGLIYLYRTSIMFFLQNVLRFCRCAGSSPAGGIPHRCDHRVHSRFFSKVAVKTKRRPLMIQLNLLTQLCYSSSHEFFSCGWRVESWTCLKVLAVIVMVS